jgi:hypothetical protein
VEAQDRRMQEQMEHGGCIHYTRAQLLKDASWSPGFLCVILCPLARSRRRAQFLSYLTNAVNYLHPSEADDPLSALPAPTKRLPTLPPPAAPEDSPQSQSTPLSKSGSFSGAEMEPRGVHKEPSDPADACRLM